MLLISAVAKLCSNASHHGRIKFFVLNFQWGEGPTEISLTTHSLGTTGLCHRSKTAHQVFTFFTFVQKHPHIYKEIWHVKFFGKKKYI